MKIKRTKVSASADVYRLDGPDGFTAEKKLPGDGVAISWAAGVLCYREYDNREGTEAPVGDYTLTLVGPTVEEPINRLRKHDPKDGVIVSWEGAR